MLEHLQEVMKVSGKSLEEVQKLWHEAKNQASRKGFKEGQPGHTRHAFQILNLLAGKKAEPKPEKKSKDADK